MPVTFNDVSYVYLPHSPYEHVALKHVNLKIEDQEFVAIIGPTGSGKSTLLQHINGLLLPSEGSINVNEYTITPKTKVRSIRNLRREAGLVFQFPEYQLFEANVHDDIAFGPKNFGVPAAEIEERINSLMTTVGLPTSLLERSPFELSGGQKRRVALCDILAMNPSILVLDEPTAGLDPRGGAKSLNLIKKLNEEQGKTIILVTHEMDIVLEYCQRVILLIDGEVKADGKPADIFMNQELLAESKIVQPQVLQVATRLIKGGLKLDYRNIKNAEDLANEIARVKKGGFIK
jgi:energy-coupling factor transport system ATP-binding protein